MSEPADHNAHMPPAHMDADTFRAHGHAMIDWIADYLHDHES